MNQQRKGQWLINALREKREALLCSNHSDEMDVVYNQLWNMSDSEFDKIMSRLEQQRVKTE